MQATIKAFKRITVEFSHEPNGTRETETMDFVRANGVAYGPGAFESHIAHILEQCGVVKPEIVKIDHRVSEPPLIEI